jgi:hypothetical protein
LFPEIDRLMRVERISSSAAALKLARGKRSAKRSKALVRPKAEPNGSAPSTEPSAGSLLESQSLSAGSAMRRNGLFCLLVELRAAEIAVLSRRGYLDANHRTDKHAVLKALYDFLDDTLR